MNAHTDALLPFQREGARFLMDKGHAYLADKPGLGKTIQAIAACDMLGAQSVVVICPAIARVNWRREFDRFGVMPNRDLFVESYDRLATRMDVRAVVEAMQPDVLILDEAHYLQNVNTKRTKAVFGLDGKSGIAAHAKHVFCLSGTPAPNSVLALFPVLRALWPHLLSDDTRTRFGFMSRYTHFLHTRYGVKVVGNRNAAELRSILARVMLRRTAEQVLPDLPPLFWSSVGIGRSDDIDNRALDDALAAVQDDMAGLLEAELQGGQNRPGAVSKMRRLVGEAKAGTAARLVSEELITGAYEKVIVFAHHTSVITKLAQALSTFGVVVVDGSVQGAARQAAIDAFQTQPGVRVFIGQLDAASTAITLTAATQVVFVEASWNPDVNEQAARRALRIGQTEPVFARILALADSLDDGIVRVIERKQRLNSEVFAAPSPQH